MDQHGRQLVVFFNRAALLTWLSIRRRVRTLHRTLLQQTEAWDRQLRNGSARTRFEVAKELPHGCIQLHLRTDSGLRSIDGASYLHVDPLGRAVHQQAGERNSRRSRSIRTRVEIQNHIAPKSDAASTTQREHVADKIDRVKPERLVSDFERHQSVLERGSIRDGEVEL